MHPFPRKVILSFIEKLRSVKASRNTQKFDFCVIPVGYHTHIEGNNLLQRMHVSQMESLRDF